MNKRAIIFTTPPRSQSKKFDFCPIGSTFSSRDWILLLDNTEFSGVSFFIQDFNNVNARPLKFPYKYIRNINTINGSTVVDTLIINILNNASISKGQLVDNNQKNLCPAPVVAYNYTTNEPSSNSTIRIEKLLTDSDTTSVGADMYIDMSGYDLDQGDLLAGTLR